MFSTANAATGEATGAGKQALDSQAVINAAPSWQKIAMGAIGDVAGGLGNLDTTGSSTGGEQFSNFVGGL
jgi:hypothetical protein